MRQEFIKEMILKIAKNATTEVEVPESSKDYAHAYKAGAYQITIQHVRESLEWLASEI